MEKEGQQQLDDAALDAIRSVIRRGGTDGMSPEEKSQYVMLICRSIGLNPLTMPIQFIRFQGKEVAYVTRGATDQLAARAGLSRFIVEGPMVKDFGGTKLLYCKAEARMPDGRTDTSIATAPARIDENALMKVESKAKRRVTLSILGLGMLAEDEADDMTASQPPPTRARGRQPVDLGRVSNPFADDDVAETVNNAVAEATGLSDPDEVALSLARVYASHVAKASDQDQFFATMKSIAKASGCASRFQKLVQEHVSKPQQPAAAEAKASVATEPAVTPAPVLTPASVVQPPAAPELDARHARVEPVPAPVAAPAPEPEPAPVDPMHAVFAEIAVAPSVDALIETLYGLRSASIETKKAAWGSACERLRDLNKTAGMPFDPETIQQTLRVLLKMRSELDARRESSTPETVEATPATFLDATPDGERLWIDHLRSKAEGDKDGGSVAGALAKRADEFKERGLLDERTRTAVNIVAEIRGHGGIEAMTFVRDILKHQSKNRGKRAESRA